MMMGIVMTILGMVLTVYVPVWAKSLEAQHMEDVSNSFADLKSTVDSQIAQGDTGSTMTTRVVLGTEGGPLLGIGQTTGGILFQPEHSMLSVYNTNDSFERYGNGFGRVVFSSNNVYYVDQEYTYENGAVILNQKGSTLMKIEPNIYVYNVSGTTEMSIVLITLQGNLDSVGGIRSQTIETNLLQYNKDTMYWGLGSQPASGKNITLTVNTSFPKVWHEYFQDLMDNRSGLNTTEYFIPPPKAIGNPADELWIVELNILDINKFTTTISYVDTKVM
jgi:hypothetical protein